MVAGYPDLRSIPSRQFARWRTAGLRLALRHSNNRLIRPPEWGQLDPSEKAAVTSLLGVVVTKLLVERLLNAPLFLFLDVHFTLTFPPNTDRMRPDFVAMTPANEWFSVEAKGRSRFRRATLNNGKEQARRLGFVNGRPVQTGVVCVTSFSNQHMEAQFADPAPAPGESIKAEIGISDAIRTYYGNLARLREFAEPAGKRDASSNEFNIQLRYSPDLDLKFGVIPELETALNDRLPDRALAILKDLSNPNMLSRDSHLGPDGIMVIPGESWQESEN